MARPILALLFVFGLTGVSFAQSIENACLRSDRDAKSMKICRCIQQAANMTLTSQDQKLAASFYGDPQKAQDMRQSSSRSHEKFWNRYKEYAKVAGTFCVNTP